MNIKNLFGKDTNKVVELCIKMYDCSNDSMFSKLCGVSKFHHVRIEWCGVGGVRQPDKWIVYHNGMRYLLNIDALRYDGIYARLHRL